MTIHKSVLLEESIEALNLKEGSVVIDATLGGGGHAREILKIIGDRGMLVVIDADMKAIERFAEFPISNFQFPNNFQIPIFKFKNIYLVNRNFSELGSILKAIGIEKVDAILADIGYSSDQLEDLKRGISFQLDAPLDMRFDQSQELTAEKILNEYSQTDLEKIIKDYGEEKFYKSIAKGILEYRAKKRIEKTGELVSIIESHVPDKYRHSRISPATKTFQALRIEVNQELDSLTQFISAAIGALAPHGRLAVISFHSLEDRIVKEIFRENARGCICPGDFPVCLCGNLAKLKILTKKPIIAGPDEVENNPRSRSAKLRVCEFIG
ncbi:MAG: 16S rRNA (cytosine(1402)-N(4))-methyltransferase RsmH [Candidatus Moranbacteria bacterium]|nr:16S rRNA (cytosine(1402)-N(4))-methyltransferase RsmH [Candidatus Moranbacteria bacterium]